MSGWVELVVANAYLAAGWVLLSLLHSTLLPSFLLSIHIYSFSSFFSSLFSLFSPFLASFSSSLLPSPSSIFLPSCLSRPLFSSWTAIEAGTGDRVRKKWVSFLSGNQPWTAKVQGSESWAPAAQLYVCCGHEAQRRYFRHNSSTKLMTFPGSQPFFPTSCQSGWPHFLPVYPKSEPELLWTLFCCFCLGILCVPKSVSLSAVFFSTPTRLLVLIVIAHVPAFMLSPLD